MTKVYIQEKWEQFTLEEQTALCCFAPFECFIYYDYEGLKDYLLPLKPWHQMPDVPYNFLYPLLKKAIDLGLFIKAPTTIAFLKIQPLFSMFLKQHVLIKIEKDFRTAITAHYYIAYYDTIGLTLVERFKSGEPTHFQEALRIMTYEYPNLTKAVKLSIQSKKGISVFISALGKYFNYYQKLSILLSFLFKIKAALQPWKNDFYRTSYISILDNIGNTYLALGQPEEAHDTYLKAINICEAIKESNELIENFRCALYTNIGNTIQDREQQIEWQRKAFKIAEELGLMDRRGSIAYNLSEALFQTRSLKESRFFLAIAMDTFSKTGAFHDQIKAYQSMSAHLQLGGQFLEAKEKLEKGLLIAHTIQDTYTVAIIYQELASVCYYTQSLVEAMDYCKKAIAEFVKTEDVQRQANAYNLLSILSFETENSQDGYDYAAKALALFHEVDDKSQMAQTYGNLALIDYKTDDYESCLSFLETSMQIYANNGEQFLLEKSRLLKASAFCGLNNYQNAQKELLQALGFFVQIEEETEIEHCWQLGNFIYDKTKDELFKDAMEMNLGDFLEEDGLE